MQHLPGDEAGFLARQEHVARRDLVRLRGARQRRLTAMLGDMLLVERSRNERRNTGPGATALTRMFLSASVCAIARVKETIAPLVEA
jgi:hypothetical protein